MSDHDRRVTELLTHNNKQLEENRAQRRKIQGLRAAISTLLDDRPGDYLLAEDAKMLEATLEETR